MIIEGISEFFKYLEEESFQLGKFLMGYFLINLYFDDWMASWHCSFRIYINLIPEYGASAIFYLLGQFRILCQGDI